MKSQVESVSEVKKIIHFEIPWEEVEKEVNKTVREFSRAARIPGFRAGKAPEKVVRSRYAQQIKDEVIRHVVPHALHELMMEQELNVVSEPELQDVMYSDGNPFLFKISVETRPQIELKDYKGIELQSENVDVKDEEVDAVLKSYQERAAELIPLADTAAGTGHFLSTKVKATLDHDGKKQKLFEDHTHVEMGSGETHRAFNENLTGKKAGDVVEFDADYPEDYPEKSIAGKVVHYTVEIESVNERRLAALDDEFAKDLGEFTSLDDLKTKIRSDILRHKTNLQRSKLRDELLKAVIDRHQFEVPETLVNRETESLLQNYARALQGRGVNLEGKDIDWKEISARLSRQADQNVRGLLLMQAVAKAEKIEVTPEDVDKSIHQIAEQEQRSPEAVKARLAKAEKMEQLSERILITKTIDFLLDQAQIQYT